LNPELVTLAAIICSIFLGWVLFKLHQFVTAHIFGRAGYVQKPLLSGNEVDFYHRLVAAAGPRWVVLPQVSMGAIMDTRLLPAHPHYWDARQEFSSKICDFVLCDARSLKPQLIVELDDRMHDFSRDRVRDCLVARAGYRTVRFWSRKKPSVAELRLHLEKALALN